MPEQTIWATPLEVPSGPRPRSAPNTYRWSADGHKRAMLTAYDYSTARIFDEAIPVLGWSVIRRPTSCTATTPPKLISIDELIPLVRGGCGAPGTHWSSPTCCPAVTRRPTLAAATRDGGAHAASPRR